MGSRTTARLVLFAVNTSIPECGPTRHGALSSENVTVADDEDLGTTILEIEVRGKRGGGYARVGPVL